MADAKKIFYPKNRFNKGTSSSHTETTQKQERKFTMKDVCYYSQPSNIPPKDSDSSSQQQQARTFTMKDFCYYTKPNNPPSVSDASTSRAGTPLPTIKKSFARRTWS